MRPLTRNELRKLVLVGAILRVLGAVAGYWFPFSADVTTLLHWSFYEAILPPQTIRAILWYCALGELVGVIGFLFFKAWGRGLLLFSHVLWYLSAPFAGVIIYTPLDAVSALGGAGIVVALTLSYFQPHSVYFEDRTPAQRKRDEEGPPPSPI